MLEPLLTLDGALLLWVQDLRTPILNAFFSFYTQLGNAGLVWIILSAAMLIHPKTRKAGFWALIAMLRTAVHQRAPQAPGGPDPALAGGGGADAPGK